MCVSGRLSTTVIIKILKIKASLSIKAIVHPRKEIMSPFFYRQVIAYLYDLLFSVTDKRSLKDGVVGVCDISKFLFQDMTNLISRYVTIYITIKLFGLFYIISVIKNKKQQITNNRTNTI